MLLGCTIRKRIIITIVLTISTVLALNKFWLHFSSMPVDMDIQGKGSEHIEVQLSKKDNNEFRKIKTGAADVNIDKTAHVKIWVDRVKFPKRIKIILSGTNNLSISNVNLRNGKLNLDLNKFKIEGANYKIKDNKLVLNAKNNIVSLIYPDQLNIRTSFKFDFMLFVIFTVLIYLLTFKLSDYIADFKTVKGKSRVDIIFLIIFFICLCIPALHINQDEISIQESRTLAVWKPLFEANYGINYNFGNNFNDWFNDRFNTRRSLLKFYINDLKYYSNPDYVEVPLGYLYKKSGWMFYNQDQFDTNNSFTPLTPDELELYTNNIKKLVQYCNKNNIKLYIIISPTKEFLYKENNLNHFYKQEKTKKLVDNIKEKTGFEIIYPVKELLNLKTHDYVFYKTDHHITDSAQYEIYKILMKRIQKNFPNVKITPQNNFNISFNNLIRAEENRNYWEGCNYIRAQLKHKSLLKTKYKYFDYKYPENIKVEGTFPYSHHFNKNGKYKVFIIGNSFMESLAYFLNTSFKDIEKYRCNASLDFPRRSAPLDMSGYLPLIKKQKPDILLIVLHSGYVDQLGGMYLKGDN